MRQSYWVNFFSYCKGFVHAKLIVLEYRKENIVLRAAVDPRLVYVIPNALVASSFPPDPAKAGDAAQQGA